jgi:hypothetical protein
MFTEENVPSCTASVVNVKHAVRKKMLMDNGLTISVSKKAVYELHCREFKSLCGGIFPFDSISFFCVPKHWSGGLPPGTQGLMAKLKIQCLQILALHSLQPLLFIT